MPFDPENVDDFDPSKCPTLFQSLTEYDEIASKAGKRPKTGKIIPCLSESMKYFNKFLKGLKDEYVQNVAKENKLKREEVNSMEVGSAF